MNAKKFLFILFFLTVFSVAASLSYARLGPQEEGSPASEKAKTVDEKVPDGSVHIDRYLILGPVSTTYPAFHEEEKKDSDASFLLSFQDRTIKSMVPVEGDPVHGLTEGDLLWSVIGTDTAGLVMGLPGEGPAVSYLATWIDIPRWMKIGVEARSTDPFELFIDGNSVIKAAEEKGDGNLGDKKSGDIKLKQGKHLLIVKTVKVPGDSLTGWRFDASVKASDDIGETPSLSLDPSTALNISHILDVPNVSSIDISPDSKLVMIGYWRFLPPDGGRDSWTEIRSLPGGELVKTIRESSMRSLKWAPTGKRLSYVSSSGGKGSIRILDLDSGSVETVIEDVKDLGEYTWSPTGTYIAYYTSDHPKDDGSGVKRLESIQDRTSYGRHRNSVFITSVPGGMTRKLATGKYDSYVSDIHPDGRKILLSRRYEDLSERPYGTSELYLLDLDDMSTRLLHKGHWMGGASWSPSGDRILIEGGPSTFGEIGRNVPDGVIPNDYDGQIYLMDPVTLKVEAITREFDPSVATARWSRADGRIYLIAEQGSYRRLYRYDPGKGRFKEFDLGIDVITSGDISRNGKIAVIEGSGADRSQRIYSVELGKEKAREIFWPGRELLSNVRLGKIEDFDFVSGLGKKIAGRVHYPPDFDPERKYPCIVYYYGGTSPVDRRFGGRYPKNLWAAKGYVVYVLQPSGATGFGQEFSTAHVNDWGKVTVQEVIEGTEKFLESHPFVNRYRVGCIGASYGGFMTQLIITRTDLFAAAVSHAGISSIASYWGEGYWGYAYNAVSAAGSFPWNRPDIYVDQSPLFSADKIVTPLLLLHGAADTNVPPGESEQMYTALKLLGKEVEYIKYSGQNHFILDYKKRKAWSDAQIAWFDKWLKGEPQWWDDMYPPLEKAPKIKPEKIGLHKVRINEDYDALLGEVRKEDIIENIEAWDSEYFDFVPDTDILPELEKKIFGVEIVCVLGTWCSDSQREIPRLWKILDELGYPVSEISMYAVGSSRFSVDLPIPARVLNWSDKLKDYYGVERVATIILYRGGEEIGRIVETPEESLEKDLLKILDR